MTTVKEIEFFIGALIVMGIAPRDRIDDYFTICPLYGVSVMRERISRDRFRLLSKFFHPSDQRNKDRQQRFRKVNMHNA